MNHDNYPDSFIRGILNTVKTIAMVGVSPKDNRPSYFAFKYLLERGYRMVPVNPGQAGKDILGQKVYAKLSEIPEPVDMVDIFRASQFAPAVVDDALAMTPRPQVIWMQLGVRNDDAAAKAEAAGIKVVMNRCPKIEYGRLSSEIGWIGVNSRTLSSKRAPLLGKGVQPSARRIIPLLEQSPDYDVVRKLAWRLVRLTTRPHYCGRGGTDEISLRACTGVGHNHSCNRTGPKPGRAAGLHERRVHGVR
jgi:predicted CoA-binding protein